MNSIVDNSNTKALTECSHLDYILVDGSGSMSTKWFNTMQALQIYLEDLQKAQAGGRIKVVTFASENHSFVCRDCTVAECKSFVQEQLQAYFTGTPLFDSIHTMACELRDLAPAKATILIVTDGDENESHYTSATQAKAFLDWLKAKGYQVIFFGCDYNNRWQAAQLGMTDDNTISVTKARLGDATKNLASKRLSYERTDKPIHFTKDEKEEFGGYLLDKSGS